MEDTKIVFNLEKCINRAIRAGFTKEQAEFLAEETYAIFLLLQSSVLL